MASADARIPCSQCGGLIHPIAGKCKHCKADLAALRGARPTAPSSLPSLAKASGTPAVTFGAREEVAEILPPRQTGSHRAVDAPSGPAWWKSWPVIVIVLASLAIVAAIVLLVMPEKKTDNKLVEPPPVAPERMNTNPLPEPKADPWATPGGSHSQADPNQKPDPNDPNHGTRPPPPDPVPPPTADPDDDIFGGLGGPQPGGGNPFGNLQLPKVAGLASGALKHACERMKSCNPNDDTYAMLCDTIDQVLRKQMGQAQVPTCAAATRCFATIDKMSCDDVDISSLSDIKQTLEKITNCSEALKC